MGCRKIGVEMELGGIMQEEEKKEQDVGEELWEDLECKPCRQSKQYKKSWDRNELGIFRNYKELKCGLTECQRID